MDTEQTRQCTMCMVWKPVTEFYKDARGKDGLTRRCKHCHSSASYASRKKTGRYEEDLEKRRSNPRQPSRDPLYMRNQQLYVKFGMTQDDYLDLIEKQDGCAICHKHEEELWGNNEDTVKYMPIDHSHETGLVRGVLCGQCNQALGKFYDSPELLMAAIAYVQGQNASNVKPEWNVNEKRSWGISQAPLLDLIAREAGINVAMVKRTLKSTDWNKVSLENRKMVWEAVDRLGDQVAGLKVSNPRELTTKSWKPTGRTIERVKT